MGDDLKLNLRGIYRCRNCGENQQGEPLGEFFAKHFLPVFDQNNFLGGPNMRLHRVHNCEGTNYLGALDLLRFEAVEEKEPAPNDPTQP